MNPEEKIEAARKKQEEGNALYNAKKYARASKRYDQVGSPSYYGIDRRPVRRLGLVF